MKETLELEGNFLLGERAWCLQEQLLSTRTLSFNKFEITFECGLCERSELLASWPFEFKSVATGLSTKKNKYLPPATTIAQSTADQENLSNFYWVVGEYSRRSLSFRKDRSPALSGLVKRFYQFHQDEYLAGIWRRDLCKSLYWSVLPEYREKCSSVGSEYVAPFWS